eukprot:Sspe_Gene.74337::Locus_45968_Transcript_3_4_Confidence_0.545_Length_1491::g.74337::m.74337
MAGLDARVGGKQQEDAYGTLLSDELPRELQPFKGLLSDRFYEMRKRVIAFVKDDVLPQMSRYHRERTELERKAPHPTEAPEPPVLHELRKKAQSRGVYNFFLPEGCVV